MQKKGCVSECSKSVMMVLTGEEGLVCEASVDGRQLEHVFDLCIVNLYR